MFVFSPEQSMFYILVGAFLLGILASFTPCIYPMIPITLGILQTQASKSLWRNFFLAFSYVCGISVIYALLGYVAATTKIFFGQWMSNPFVIFFVVLFFLYLAFSMFGYYEIYVPKFLTKHKDIKVKGSFLYSFLFGMISGTVASPCLTPALAILLGYVAKVGNPIFGFLTLFSFAFGMGLLLIFIGTFSTTITLLPKSGAWMIEVKKFFGFMLLAVCIYFLQPFLGIYISLKLYAILSLIASVYYFSTAQKSRLKIIFGFLLAILFIFLLSLSLLKLSKLYAFNAKQNQLLASLDVNKS